MKRQSLAIASVGVLTLAVSASCTSMREGMEGQKDAIARVEGHTLTVEHAANLLTSADESLWPRLPGLVEPIVDLWIGYTLLATDLASEEAFSHVDLTPLMQRELDQEAVWRLRERVILKEIEPSDEELRATYEAEQYFTVVEVEQILLRVPEDADQAQADSVGRFADQLRERVLAGESFGDLARTYSQDPTSASNGGRLGWVGHDRLVPGLDSIVFHMEPGTISETVRSDLGYHIVRVTDRQEPDFEEVREEYKVAVMNRTLGNQEGVYIDSLMTAADIRIVDGAVSLVRRLSFDPRVSRLSPAERDAQLARYRGGALTLGDWADFVLRFLPESRRAFAGDSSLVTEGLIELVRNKLLVKAAHDMDMTVSEEKVDSIRALAYRELHTVAAVAGMQREALANGEMSVQEAVDQVLIALLNQQGSPQPLERASMALKSGRTYQVYPERFPLVIDHIMQTGTAREPGS